MISKLSKLLIANRGEIACRVIRTARRLGIRTVAVYSEADAGALHVEMADEAHRIGPAPAAQSYLDADRIIEAARRSGAGAVHPGYGFLSESAGFAAACVDAGLVSVGPPAAAIRAMGSKSEAKARLHRAGVPLVPGYHGPGQSAAALAGEAARIGFPVLVKASAGGGGRGMRVAGSAAAFPAAVEAARREAAAAFGDGRLLLEKYLPRARHVEVQVLADAHGACLSLFDRDCSIQRRHQKVVEEAPAPRLDPATRRAMGEAAIAAARAIGYVNAGTVEFLLDAEGAFHFMEMNTRLQVEHPVTELITGLDLVEWQLRIAAGEALPFGQEALVPDGHAIEVRLYAEDPRNGFLPAAGRLDHLRLAAPSRHVRIDSGVREGDAIGLYYDPMIAKLIVWDRDRPAALRRLRAALDECRIVGPATNIELLRAVAAHPAFAAAELDTSFVERHAAALLPPPRPVPREAVAIAALAVLLERRREAAARARDSADPASPWHFANGWRLNGEAAETLVFREEPAGNAVGVAAGSADGIAAGVAAGIAVEVHCRRDGRYRLELAGGPPIEAACEPAEAGGDGLVAELDGVRRRATVVRQGLDLVVLTRTGTHRLTLVDPIAAAEQVEAPGGRLTAPMPGRIVAVLVAAGQTVAKGDPLVVLEAMKMEHTVTAPAAGIITTLPFAPGEQVEEGRELIGFETN